MSILETVRTMRYIQKQFMRVLAEIAKPNSIRMNPPNQVRVPDFHCSKYRGVPIANKIQFWKTKRPKKKVIAAQNVFSLL